MKILVHPTFIPAAVELLKRFDDSIEFEYFPYPDDSPPDEWLVCVGKERPRPVVLSADETMMRNSVAKQALRESGCIHVCFSTAWMKMPWTQLAWKLLKAWPDVTAMVGQTANQAIISVSINGKCFRSNL